MQSNKMKKNEVTETTEMTTIEPSTMRHFHDLPSEMSQPVIVNTTQRMFGGCEDMDPCCPGSRKAKQLEDVAFFFFNEDILLKILSCDRGNHSNRRDLTL